MKKTWQDDLEEWKKSGVFPSVKKDSVEVKVKKQKTLDSSNEANVVKNQFSHAAICNVTRGLGRPSYYFL